MKILGSVKHILGIDAYNNIIKYISVDDSMKSQCTEADFSEAIKLLNIPCREPVGTLLWIANGTHPDIDYAVKTLAIFTSNPGASSASFVTCLMITYSHYQPM
jgi:hypothetical protein